MCKASWNLEGSNGGLRLSLLCDGVSYRKPSFHGCGRVCMGWLFFLFLSSFLFTSRSLTIRGFTPWFGGGATSENLL